MSYPGTTGKITHLALCKMVINENVSELTPSENDLNRHKQILDNTELSSGRYGFRHVCNDEQGCCV